MKSFLTAVFATVSILACSQQSTEVHQVQHSKKQVKQTLANKVDPICNMKVDASVKDTAVYKGKTYGFCNPMCKQEFKKNPKKYVK